MEMETARRMQSGIEMGMVVNRMWPAEELAGVGHYDGLKLGSLDQGQACCAVWLLAACWFPSEEGEGEGRMKGDEGGTREGWREG